MLVILWRAFVVAGCWFLMLMFITFMLVFMNLTKTTCLLNFLSFWLYWCYNHHLKENTFFFQNWVQRSVKMCFLGRYGDTFTAWNSPSESKENSRLFTVLSLYLFWFARGVFSLSPFMKQVLRMGNLINLLFSNFWGRLICPLLI